MGTNLENDTAQFKTISLTTSESGSEAENCFNLKTSNGDSTENTFTGEINTNGDHLENCIDIEENPEETEEKARMICQVLELQNTLEDLSQRVDNVKEENMKLKSENQVLGQYIENLMSNSSVFQSTNAKGKKK